MWMMRTFEQQMPRLTSSQVAGFSSQPCWQTEDASLVEFWRVLKSQPQSWVSAIAKPTDPPSAGVRGNPRFVQNMAEHGWHMRLIAVRTQPFFCSSIADGVDLKPWLPCQGAGERQKPQKPAPAGESPGSWKSAWETSLEGL